MDLHAELDALLRLPRQAAEGARSWIVIESGTEHRSSAIWNGLLELQHEPQSRSCSKRRASSKRPVNGGIRWIQPLRGHEMNICNQAS